MGITHTVIRARVGQWVR